MRHLSLTALGVKPLLEEEMVGVGGGFSWMQSIANLVFSEVVKYAPEIYESAKATKRTFETHPEIFIK